MLRVEVLLLFSESCMILPAVLLSQYTCIIDIQDWAWHHHSVNGCARSWHLYWLWSQHAGACLAICRGLLRSPTSATQHSKICSVICVGYRSMVVVLVLSRLDYGNATLAGLLTCLLNRLQSSPSSTRQLGRSPVSVARSILQMLSPVSTGFEHPTHKVQTGGHCLQSSSRHGAPQYLSSKL